jgi:hypothetical protein
MLGENVSCWNLGCNFQGIQIELRQFAVSSKEFCLITRLTLNISMQSPQSPLTSAA